MINFSDPILMQHIEDVDHREFLIFITNHCLKGNHPD